MLHLIHLLERRFGTQRTSHIGMRLLLASALLLMLGLGLLSGLLPAINAMRLPIVQTFQTR